LSSANYGEGLLVIVFPLLSFFGDLDLDFFFIIGLKAEVALLCPHSDSRGSGEILFQPPPPIYFKIGFPPLFYQSGLL